MSKKNILMIVEGNKREPALMKHLLESFGIDEQYEIYSYNTEIYTLYEKIFSYANDAIDILQVLKENEHDNEKRLLLDKRYSDILLIFDLDPQALNYEEGKICKMAQFFFESTDLGKLYINYPMVESFYHMKSIPDPDYNEYYSTMEELYGGDYKARVNRESYMRDYKKFAKTKKDCSIVISQNIEKARRLVDYSENVPSTESILRSQLVEMKMRNRVAVLCTCPFFIYDYNPRLLDIPEY